MINRQIVRAALLTALSFSTVANGNAQRRGTLVVTNKGENTASVIDLASARIVSTIPTGNGPHEVAMSGDGRIAVVTDYGARGAPGNSLTVIDVENASLIKRIDLGVYSQPHGAFFLPGDSLLAVTSESTGNVIMVRIPEGDIAQTISTDQDGSHMVTSITAEGLAYTSNMGSGSISELNVNDGTINRIIEVAPQVEAIQVTPDGREVWVGSNARGTVA